MPLEPKVIPFPETGTDPAIPGLPPMDELWVGCLYPPALPMKLEVGSPDLSACLPFWPDR